MRNFWKIVLGVSLIIALAMNFVILMTTVLTPIVCIVTNDFVVDWGLFTAFAILSASSFPTLIVKSKDILNDMGEAIYNKHVE